MLSEMKTVCDGLSTPASADVARPARALQRDQGSRQEAFEAFEEERVNNSLETELQRYLIGNEDWCATAFQHPQAPYAQ